MSKLEHNLEKFKGVLDPLTKTMTYGKKEYINKLFAEIITEVNMIEASHEQFKAKQLGFNDKEEYLDSLTKAISILQGIGFTSIDFNRYKKELLEWVIDHVKEMKKELTAKSFDATYRWVAHFELFNNRLPESTDELKKYIEEVIND